jgi:ornithine carbamoyltransferase
MADLMTFEEHRGPIAGRRIAWIGDANNVLASWMQATTRFSFQLVVAAPEEFAPSADEIARARQNGGDVEVVTRAEQAAEGADCIIADTWVSMGDDEEAERRHRLLKPYQVTAKLMARANPDAIFMHCLPVHRGEEVTAEVIDGPQSVVFDEAENRLHAQKGILAWCFGADGRP